MRNFGIKLKKFIVAFPKWFAVYLSVASIFGFGCFILEESFQTEMFSVWLSVPQEEWKNVKRTIDLMEKTRTTLVVVNNIGGWINPIGYVSYASYAEAERIYIDALKSKCFANAPELFDGEVVRFYFRPNEIEYAKDHLILRNGKMAVRSMEDFQSQEVTGKVELENGKVIVDARK